MNIWDRASFSVFQCLSPYHVPYLESDEGV
jgi:hypothetical protein